MSVLLFVACENKYVISGEVKNQNLDGKKIYLLSPTDEYNVYEKTDSTIIENNSFTFEGTFETEIMSIKALLVEGEEYSVIHNPSPYNRMLVLELGTYQFVLDTICSIKTEDLSLGMNNRLNSVKETYAIYYSEWDKINDLIREHRNNGTLTDSLIIEFDNAYNKLEEDLDNFMFKFVKDNIANPLGEYMFFEENFTIEQKEEILKFASEDFRSKEKIKNILEEIERYNKVKVGQKFTDFTMKDINNSDISLSDFAGKGDVVLVEFWAAWCPPCITRDLPYLIDAYDKYKDKGFVIVGVSIDEDKNRWIKAINDNNIPWAQMCQEKENINMIQKLYAFNYISFKVLIDGEGIIIARDFDCEELDGKLAEIFGE